MMIRVVTDSVASLPQDLVEDLNIDVVSLFVHHEGKEYDDATMDLDDFYGHIYEMVDNIPTSSQPSQANLEELFEGYAQAGDEDLASGSRRNFRERMMALCAQLVRWNRAISDSSTS